MAKSNPNPKRAEAGLSLLALLKYAVPYTKNKAKEVVVKRFSEKQTKGKMPAVVAVCQSIENNKRGDPHKVTVIGLDPAQPKITKQKKILVSCDCGDFWSTWEYSLWTWGAAKIQYCNGEPAVVKNPQNYPGTCLAGDTLVSTVTGDIPIRDIKVGDLVMTLMGERRVTAHRSMGIKDTIATFTSSGMGVTIPLVSTKDHPVHTPRGVSEWTAAGELEENDSVTYVSDFSLFKFGLAGVTRKEDRGLQEVFDITVEEAEHFIANGVVVHNCKHVYRVLREIKTQGG